MDRQPFDGDTGFVQLVEQAPERVDGAVGGDLEDELVLVGCGCRSLGDPGRGVKRCPGRAVARHPLTDPVSPAT